MHRVARPYVEKLAACDHEDDLQLLNPAAAAFQPSAAAAAANIPPAADLLA